MTDEQKLTRVMSRAEYDAAIAAGEAITAESLIIVEPVGDPEPISEEDAEQMAKETSPL